ncbi:MAG: ATP-binding protein, partial [Bacillus sp. (in: firmicutes)]
LKSTYNKASEQTEEELLSHLERMDLLVLDDVGAEKTKKEDDEFSWAKSKMFEIIDSRIGKHTIYTTNFEHTELLKMYGERNFSRMMENTHVEKMNGENYRLRDFK